MYEPPNTKALGVLHHLCAGFEYFDGGAVNSHDAFVNNHATSAAPSSNCVLRLLVYACAFSNSPSSSQTTVRLFTFPSRSSY